MGLGGVRWLVVLHILLVLLHETNCGMLRNSLFKGRSRGIDKTGEATHTFFCLTAKICPHSLKQNYHIKLKIIAFLLSKYPRDMMQASSEKYFFIDRKKVSRLPNANTFNVNKHYMQ